jgi:predicted RNase H-like HicB family nuclease
MMLFEQSNAVETIPRRFLSLQSEMMIRRIPMVPYFILSEYIKRAMAQAEYDKLEDGTFSGRISACKGVIAFGITLRECEEELHSTLEDWLLVGFKLGHVFHA